MWKKERIHGYSQILPNSASYAIWINFQSKFEYLKMKLSKENNDKFWKTALDYSSALSSESEQIAPIPWAG